MNSTRPNLEIDVLIDCDGWADTNLDASAIARRAALAACDRTRPLEISILLCDDARIRELNRQWRGKDEPTDTLSFPGDAPALGDVVVAYETAAADAKLQGKALTDHLTHLVVHGCLHLLDFGHAESEEAEIMEAREREVLATLGIADPYALP